MITDATMRNPGALPHRSMLFVPGSNASMMTNAYVFGADAIMFDLEDAVALREKDSARLMVFHALQSPVYAGTDTVVRINPLDTPYGHDDLLACVRAGVRTIRLPKTESADDIHELEAEVEKAERECGREVGSTRLMAAIESAGGVVNAVQIATASPRMVSIALAGFDYVIDMRTTRSEQGTELFYARCAVLHAARVAGLACYDVVWSDVDDEEGFLAEVELIKRLGFDGKSLVNPRQIHLLHQAYAPTEAELSRAQLVVAAARRTIAFAETAGVRQEV